ncbi:unnamed protein product [Cercopithifilaria johnstoni]|uniref:Uncharacterized protein n=1 Tax=Cercopithifilaria johnstoni TaxID=2874296 RepID=A0A8J2Q5D5_9BILA|nr:unnamed protein product [Cercopithifilaria johnstoni]
MQIVDDNCSKDERCRMTLLPSSSSSTSGNLYVPVTTVNMQPNRMIRNSCAQYHDNGSNNDGNDNNDDDNDNDNSDDNIEVKKMKQNANGPFFGSTSYHYLQIDRNSINILLKAAAAFMLLCIAGCLVLQHLRISQLDYRIRRIELNSAHSIQKCLAEKYYTIQTYR